MPQLLRLRMTPLCWRMRLPVVVATLGGLVVDAGGIG